MAINPPGAAQQYFRYDNPDNGIALTYSDQFAPMDIPTILNNKTDLYFALQMIDTGSYANTNLGEAYLAFGSSFNPQVVAACQGAKQDGGAPETPQGSVKFNGYEFAYFTSTGVGAGNIYDQHVYRTVNNGRCYEAIAFVHYSNIGNYPPGVVKEFDLAGLLEKFKGALATMQLK